MKYCTFICLGQYQISTQSNYELLYLYLFWTVLDKLLTTKDYCTYICLGLYQIRTEELQLYLYLFRSVLEKYRELKEQIQELETDVKRNIIISYHLIILDKVKCRIFQISKFRFFLTFIISSRFFFNVWSTKFKYSSIKRSDSQHCPLNLYLNNGEDDIVVFLF